MEGVWRKNGEESGRPLSVAGTSRNLDVVGQNMKETERYGIKAG